VGGDKERCGDQQQAAYPGRECVVLHACLLGEATVVAPSAREGIEGRLKSKIDFHGRKL
jgi:hypothetical protein